MAGRVLHRLCLELPADQERGVLLVGVVAARVAAGRSRPQTGPGSERSVVAVPGPGHRADAQDWAIAGQPAGIVLGYRPEAWRPIYQSFLQHDNWHFLGYLFFVAMLLLMWRVRQFGSDLAPVTAVVLSALALCLCLFLFTHYAIGAVRLTSLNRVCLQLMPAVAFLTLLVYAKVAMAASGSQPGRRCPQDNRASVRQRLGASLRRAFRPCFSTGLFQAEYRFLEIMP